MHQTSMRSGVSTTWKWELVNMYETWGPRPCFTCPHYHLSPSGPRMLTRPSLFSRRGEDLHEICSSPQYLSGLPGGDGEKACFPHPAPTGGNLLVPRVLYWYKAGLLLGKGSKLAPTTYLRYRSQAAPTGEGKEILSPSLPRRQFTCLWRGSRDGKKAWTLGLRHTRPKSRLAQRMKSSPPPPEAWH